MLAVTFVLSLLFSTTSAQLVLGESNGSVSGAAIAPDAPVPTDSAISSSVVVDIPTATQFGVAQPTPPPTTTGLDLLSVDVAAMTSAMPYASFLNGAYQQMQCGYGHQRAHDGRCVRLPWVCFVDSS
jgi:hypothetical protein